MGEELGRGVDALTITVPLSTAAFLCTQTVMDEPGGSRAGFVRSEKRMCMGGFCWRRWEPRQECKAWGRSYESWDWAGSEAMPFAHVLRAHEGRPSRADVKWDFQCSPDLVPRDLAELVRGRCVAYLGPEPFELAGPERTCTVYVGSRKSDRFIRIYRKDLQDAAVKLMLGPVMRVELVQKDDCVRGWWSAWCEDEGRGYAAAAAVVEKVTGLRVQDEVGDVPELVMPEESDDVVKLIQLVEQYGPTIAKYQAAGVPLLDLARAHVRRLNKFSASRWRRQVEQLRKLNLRQMVATVRRHCC